MASTPNQPGILPGRHDGVIVILDNDDMPAELAAELNHVLDVLGRRRAQPLTTTRHDEREDPNP